ncbi:hypothetical protein BKA61DRAFT_675955 [Leptodontidium sp. MPI-SDFR-AT-0119]|nr:hypothetical protein BKA61DRAFT_675955 [Leptodontidium sp. MPI-SDFR-AT-0119]
MPKETKPKGVSNRVAPVTSAARKARKQEVRGKIQETTLNVDKHCNDVAEKKAKLEELSKTPLDSSRPGERAKYDNLKAEIAKLDGELIEWEGELEKLNKEDKDIDIKGEEDSDSGGLFVPPREPTTKEDNDFNEEETKQFSPDYRLRDLKVAKKFVRKRRELLGIAGLAYNCDLKDLKPREKGETRRKKWEVRSSIRHLFSNAKKYDVYIYKAAKWHAAYHEEWQNGQREAKDRSPTLVPNSRLSPTPAPSQPEIKTEDKDNGNPLATTSSTASSKASQQAAILQYREQ